MKSKNSALKKMGTYMLLLLTSLLLIAFLVKMQKEEGYLYDVSILHFTYLYIIAGVFAVGLCLAFIIRNDKFTLAMVEANVLGFFLIFNFLLCDALFCFWVSSSQTNNIANYKKFDVQVQPSVLEFFPDLQEDYEVVKYDYYYNFSYHHVYSIYLEIKVNGDMGTLLAQYRKGEYIEQVFYHDNSFIEISFYDRISYEEEDNRMYGGGIKKVLYSLEEKTMIFQCFESWAFCDADEIYYFERFNIDPAAYNISD